MEGHGRTNDLVDSARVKQADKLVQVTTKAIGSFGVKIGQLTSDHLSVDHGLARMSIDKEFQGDLVATSSGEMLSAGTSVPSSAGYVAIEKVSGSLNGRSGTFVLQHTGTM